MKFSDILTWGLYLTGVAEAAKSSVQDDNFINAQEKVAEMVEGFRSHNANKGEFFDWFEKEIVDGFTPKQFEEFTKNYLYRTAGTLPSVAQTLSYVALRGDYPAVRKITQNAREEGGGIGKDDQEEYAHMELCEKSFNMLGDRVFGTSPIRVADIKEEDLLPATIEFRNTQIKSFFGESNRIGESLVGRYLAHENAAPGMLRAFEGLFKLYRGYFTEEEYKEMTQYFRAHITEEVELEGVEDRHGKDAMLVAASTLYRNLTEKAEKEMIRGGKEMLDTQEALWNAMKRRLEELSKLEEKITPIKDRYLISQDDQTPNTSPKKYDACDVRTYLDLALPNNSKRR